MGRMLAGRGRSVVATEAIGRDAGMIEVRGNPPIRRVANFAIVSGWNMDGMFACCGGSIVTGHAVG